MAKTLAQIKADYQYTGKDVTNGAKLIHPSG